MSRCPRRGLYAVTDGRPRPPRDLAALVEAVIRGGAVMVQYRDKGTDGPRRRAEAEALAVVCRGRVPLVINDDVELAAAVGAAGVHLGRDDPGLGEARRRLGPDAIIGISCYGEPGRAVAAQAAGADYVAFGRFFPSTTKPEAVQADLEMLRRVRPRLVVPVVAIGGITPDNAAALLEAGADLLAVVQGVFGAADPGEAAARYRAHFAASHPADPSDPTSRTCI